MGAEGAEGAEEAEGAEGDGGQGGQGGAMQRSEEVRRQGRRYVTAKRLYQAIEDSKF